MTPDSSLDLAIDFVESASLSVTGEAALLAMLLDRMVRMQERAPLAVYLGAGLEGVHDRQHVARSSDPAAFAADFHGVRMAGVEPASKVL